MLNKSPSLKEAIPARIHILLLKPSIQKNAITASANAWVHAISPGFTTKKPHSNVRLFFALFFDSLTWCNRYSWRVEQSIISPVLPFVMNPTSFFRFPLDGSIFTSQNLNEKGSLGLYLAFFCCGWGLLPLYILLPPGRDLDTDVCSRECDIRLWAWRLCWL